MMACGGRLAAWRWRLTLYLRRRTTKRTQTYSAPAEAHKTAALSEIRAARVRAAAAMSSVAPRNHECEYARPVRSTGPAPGIASQPRTISARRLEGAKRIKNKAEFRD
jgi:hypothetical protein